MALAYELTEAPGAEVAGFYKEVDGKYVLDVEGVVPESKFKESETKLSEFRNNNITLKQQLEKVTQTPLNNTPVQQIDVEAAIEARIGEMKSHYSTQVTTLETEKKQLAEHLERVVLSDSVKEAALKYGVHESALPDVLNRAKETFTVADGKAVSKTKAVDKEGKPLEVSSWIHNLSETAPHLFAPSRGSGAQRTVKGGQPVSERTSAEKIAAGLAAKKQ